MIPYHFQIYASVSFFFLCKIICYLSSFISMFDKKLPTLMSDSGKEETDEDVCKWIPKKKHEVLKAKYKCLKKLFQIYDASVIGILPEPYGAERREERRHSRRRRSHRTKTDACAGTADPVTQAPAPVLSPAERSSLTTAVVRDLKLQYTSTSTQESLVCRDKYTQDCKDILSVTTSEKECECTQTSEILHATPFVIMKDSQPKPTRFQLFLQRILGIRREKSNNGLPSPHMYAASDNNITNRYEKRRRRGMRFRRLRGAKKVYSESALRERQSPVILSYVQSVQRNCLMDTTPRQCPFMGCRMIFYGIINYNDHINLCHFTDRKFSCHYCHEGFLKERDKLLHENEHIGISKLSTNLTSTISGLHSKVANVTQTDPEPKQINEEKLKKIVSFFDKIEDPEEIIAELKKSRHSTSSVNLTHHSSKVDTVASGASKSTSNSRRSSCVHLQKADRKSSSSVESDTSSVHTSGSSLRCQICGQKFDDIQHLNMHVNAEHRSGSRCSGQGRSERPPSPPHYHDNSDYEEPPSVLANRSYSTLHHVNTSSTLTRFTSEEKSAMSYDPSTNIIYYSSSESVKNPSVMGETVKRGRAGFNSYKWEPGTDSIHA
ncbi:uncharacterized protein LOC106709466 [Papilio machaon]|uniref:uncharacterized protein LOC106709466 n=1 Tax=Papilio machaon TaxID=76193 RepID=UPI001E6634B9|nr:uncharacterized protein LOC106709466 [Papilio machaon]